MADKQRYADEAVRRARRGRLLAVPDWNGAIKQRARLRPRTPG